MGVDTVVTKPEFIDQGRPEEVCPTGSEAAIGVVFNAAEKTSAVAETWKRSGNRAGLVFIAEAEEAVVFLGVLLIDANVEVVAVFRAHWIREIVDGGIVENILRRIKRCQPEGQRIERAATGYGCGSWDHIYWIPAAIVAERDSAKAGWPREKLRQPRIEDLTRVGGMTIAIQGGVSVRIK